MQSLNGLYAGVLLATVAVCYYNAIPCGFVFDDLSAVRDNKGEFHRNFQKINFNFHPAV